MARTNHVVSAPAFIVDHNSESRDPGRQVDWSGVTAGPDGRKVIPAGTVVAAVDATGKIVPRGSGANPPDDTTTLGILLTTAVEGERHAALTGYGVMVGGGVYEELLAHELSAAMKTELAAAGPGFYYREYVDDRA